MADIYVRSLAEGDNDGSDWENAFVAFGSAVTAATSADRILVAHDHDESLGASTIYTFPQTVGLQVLCVNTGTGALATTGTIATDQGNHIITLRNNVYVYGLRFIAGNAGIGTSKYVYIDGARSNGTFKNCYFGALGASAIATLRLAYSSTHVALLDGCTCGFAVTGQRITHSEGRTIIRNLSLDSGATIPTTLFIPVIPSGEIMIENCDFSSYALTNLFASPGNMTNNRILRNCKLRDGTNLLDGSDNSSWGRLKIHNCDFGATNYKFSELCGNGSITQETTIVRTNGASDGTTPLSWKTTSLAWVKEFLLPLESPEITKWNEDTGEELTATIEIVNDGLTLKDNEVWLEVQYLGDATSPKSTIVSDRMATAISTPANQDASTVDWTTTGLTTPVKQKLSVSFTPQMKGVIHAKVMLARPETTIYVCPKLTIT